MRNSRFVFMLGALSVVASTALMLPAAHAAGDERRMEGRTPDQSPASEASGDRGTRERIDDQMLETRVKAALIGNDQTKARNIEVEVRDGVVHLQGEVETTAEADAAARVAKGVEGVREVRSTLSPGRGR
ncbi:MAG: BON domain-containing protein [Thauera sp.]|nr:BON domain-containing protein [Thauera sp.]